MGKGLTSKRITRVYLVIASNSYRVGADNTMAMLTQNNTEDKTLPRIKTSQLCHYKHWV